jgi:hypothetical protein
MGSLPIAFVVYISTLSIRTDMRVYIKEELSYTISPSRDYLHITYKNFIYSTFVTIFANILESKQI